MWLPLAVVVLQSIGCGSSPTWSDEEQMGDAWSYADSVQFIMPIADTTAPHQLILEITHTEAYAYRNLYLQIHSTSPSGTQRSQQLNVDMADIGGAWLGQCRRGQCRIAIPLAHQLIFSELGDYIFTCHQYTRQDPLIGLTGLRLELW